MDTFVNLDDREIRESLYDVLTHTLDLIRRLVEGHRGWLDGKMIWLISSGQAGLVTRAFRRLYLLNPPTPPGSSLNHEGNHKSYHAVSLLSHVHLSNEPNTQARSIGHRTW